LELFDGFSWRFKVEDLASAFVMQC
jgi:hypothetical protein